MDGLVRPCHAIPGILRAEQASIARAPNPTGEMTQSKVQLEAPVSLKLHSFPGHAEGRS